MNETGRISLERHLQKKFPKFGISVSLSENGKSISIVGNGYTTDDRFAIYRASDEYTLKAWGWKTDWGESYY